jgi:hypothetical protein
MADDCKGQANAVRQWVAFAAKVQIWEVSCLESIFEILT